MHYQPRLPPLKNKAKTNTKKQKPQRHVDLLDLNEKAKGQTISKGFSEHAKI